MNSTTHMLDGEPVELQPLAQRMRLAMKNLPVAEPSIPMGIEEFAALLRSGKMGSTELPPNQTW